MPYAWPQRAAPVTESGRGQKLRSRAACAYVVEPEPVAEHDAQDVDGRLVRHELEECRVLGEAGLAAVARRLERRVLLLLVGVDGAEGVALAIAEELVQVGDVLGRERVAEDDHAVHVELVHRRRVHALADVHHRRRLQLRLRLRL